MSIQAVAWALDQDLPARPKLVLVSIANHANHTDGYCWLRATTIAAEAACTPRSVYRFIGGLVRNGYLRKAPRKGDDGKQRANDYWILFTREDAAWDWGAGLGEDRDADEPQEATDDAPQEVGKNEGGPATETQDVVQPHDTASHGAEPLPDDSSVARQAVEKHALSPGPTDNGVTRKRIAEPSKIKPKESSAGARVRGAPPRAYRPPPPQPMGAIADHEAKQIFVYEGSRAYDAWAKRMSHENGIRNWHLVTNKCVDGKWKSGWYFPSLFPPDDPKATDPPSDHLTDEDAKEFLKRA